MALSYCFFVYQYLPCLDERAGFGGTAFDMEAKQHAADRKLANKCGSHGCKGALSVKDCR